MRILWIFVLLACVSSLQAAPIDYGDDGWSKPVHGLRARLHVVEGEVTNGTNLMQIYLELQNVSDNAAPLYIQYSPSSSVRGQLIDTAGKPVTAAGLPASILTTGPYQICLPWDSTLRFNITAIGWGVPANEKALIGLMNDAWIIKQDDNATYLLKGSFTASPSPEKSDLRLWTGTIELPAVKFEQKAPIKKLSQNASGRLAPIFSRLAALEFLSCMPPYTERCRIVLIRQETPPCQPRKTRHHPAQIHFEIVSKPT